MRRTLNSVLGIAAFSTVVVAGACDSDKSDSTDEATSSTEAGCPTTTTTEAGCPTTTEAGCPTTTEAGCPTTTSTT